MDIESFSPVLENERVILRPIKESDLEYLKPFSVNEPEIWKYSLISAAGEENLKYYLELALQKHAAGAALPFIIYDKQLGEYAGSSRLYEINEKQKNLLLGYTWYGKKFQGTGLNKNCKYLLLKYAFEKMGMHRVELRADNNNERSKAAMRSIGAVEEGILRSESVTSEGGRRDSIVFSILKNEWENNVKPKLEQFIASTQA